MGKLPQQTKERLQAMATIPEDDASRGSPSANAAKASSSAEGGKEWWPWSTGKGPAEQATVEEGVVTESSMAPAAEARMDGPVTEDKIKATEDAKELFRQRKETHPVTPVANHPKS